MENTTTHYLPHLAIGPFNSHAFNALAVADLITAFHAGHRLIFMTAEQHRIAFNTSPYNALLELGWEFPIIQSLPESLLSPDRLSKTPPAAPPHTDQAQTAPAVAPPVPPLAAPPPPIDPSGAP